MLGAMPSQRQDNHRQQAVLLVAMATVAIAFKGIFARFAYLEGTGVTELLLLRFVIATPLFLFIARLLAPGRGRADADFWRGCLAAGVLFFIATLCDFTAIERIGASLSRIILFTFPIFVILLTALRDRRPPPGGQVVLFFVIYAALWLVVMPEGPAQLSARSWEGILWALGSAVSYAAFLVTSQVAMTRMGSVRFTALYNLVVLVLMLAYAALVDPPRAWPSAAAIQWGAAIAIGCTVIPFFLLFEGIRRVGAAQASLITLAGPVITVLAAWLFLDEAMQPIQWLGLATLVVGMGLLSGPESWRQGLRRRIGLRPSRNGISNG
ncbi:MAG: DMT family transporter [Gammaproteobacteria bacterium]